MRSICLAIAVVMTSLGWGGCTQTHVEPAQVSQQSLNHLYWPDSPATQFIFFAVLEGLYTDGVPNDVVDVIIPPGAKPGAPPIMQENFVYACQICHPSYEAFRLYRLRQDFYGLKRGGDTFSQHFDPAVAAQIKSPDKAVRRAAIQKLIQTWIARRIDEMRLTPTEHATLTAQIDAMRKQSARMLESYKKDSADSYYGTLYKDWTGCPMCDGASGACHLADPK